MNKNKIQISLASIVLHILTIFSIPLLSQFTINEPSQIYSLISKFLSAFNKSTIENMLLFVSILSALASCFGSIYIIHMLYKDYLSSSYQGERRLLVSWIALLGFNFAVAAYHLIFLVILIA